MQQKASGMPCISHSSFWHSLALAYSGATHLCHSPQTSRWGCLHLGLVDVTPDLVLWAWDTNHLWHPFICSTRLNPNWLVSSLAALSAPSSRCPWLPLLLPGAASPARMDPPEFLSLGGATHPCLPCFHEHVLSGLNSKVQKGHASHQPFHVQADSLAHLAKLSIPA